MLLLEASYARLLFLKNATLNLSYIYVAKVNSLGTRYVWFSAAL